MLDLMEPYSCNGSYTMFDAGTANPFVGLTDAPCIAEEMSCDDDGDNQVEGRLWWFPNYMVRSYVQDLIDTGETIFTAT